MSRVPILKVPTHEYAGRSQLTLCPSKNTCQHESAPIASAYSSYLTIGEPSLLMQQLRLAQGSPLDTTQNLAFRKYHNGEVIQREQRVTLLQTRLHRTSWP